MWLIDTTTLELKLVGEPADIEYSYAILSHTWSDEEVSYQDIQNIERASRMKGFGKIVGTCRLASARGLRYAWVDTCCIDKSSSAELSEAINSMFRWYTESAVCVAFLEDLPSHGSFEDYFPSCKWLTRGWTLQELIAPRVVEFYDASWTFRGCKPELNSFLAGVTRIDQSVLSDSQAVFEVPVARRMSWASMRQTTRIEDKAYCLLGIFGVHMPMIYGEGSNAFMRLQEEIVKDNGDLSIFAWVDSPPGLSGVDGWMRQTYRGVFARSPREFAGCHQIRQRIRGVFLNKEFTVTNKGLRIEAALVDVPSDSQDLILNLGVSDQADWSMNDPGGWVGVYLAKTANGYVRSKPYSLFKAAPGTIRYRCDRALLHIQKDLRASESESIEKRFRRAIYLDFSQAPCQIIGIMPLELWDGKRSLFLNLGEGINAYLLLRFWLPNQPNSSFRLLVTFSTMFEPVCAIWTENHPLWDSMLKYMNQAKELSDYVAANYLRMQLESLGTSQLSSADVCKIEHPQSNSVSHIQTRMESHVFEAQPCFRLKLILEHAVLNNAICTEGIIDRDL
ncbi:HET-domain-containing protein [Hypoxylon sp. NC0597]|nr:HET-domain-containing protein [Hypoxylon sp. NC0597]